MTALSLMDSLRSGQIPGRGTVRRIMRPATSRFLRPRAIAGARLRPPGAETGTIGDAGLAAVNREIPRAQKNRARLQSIEPADRMAEMRRVGVADVLRQARQIDILVRKVQQMPRALPGAKGAERYAGLLLEQMQEPRRRQTSRCGTIGRRHLAGGEIVELCGGSLDAAIQPAVRQRFAKAQLVEFSGGKAATPLLQPQGLVSGANSPRDIGRASPGNSCAQILHRRGLDRFRFDHKANDAGMLALNAVRHIGRNDG